MCIYKGTMRFSQHHGPISEGLREESDHDLPEAIGGDFVLAVATLKHPPRRTVYDRQRIIFCKLGLQSVAVAQCFVIRWPEMSCMCKLHKFTHTIKIPLGVTVF